MKLRHLLLLAVCSFCVWPQVAAQAAIVFDDDFDSGGLASNPTGIGGGVNGTYGNGVSVAGSATETSSQAQITDGTGNNNHGIRSLNDFDLSAEFTATWDVASVDLSGSGLRRTFYSLMSGTAFVVGNDQYINISLDPSANSVELLFGSAGVFENVTQNVSISDDDLDGFTLTATFTTTGYSVTSVGLNATAQVNISGTWAGLANGHTFASVFGASDMYMVASIQDTGATGSSFDVDRMTLDVVPEPSALMLAALGIAGAVSARRRRR
ncbi:MAG: PEP-CTERM sorting domain-containing protein [Pirellulales bacterium]|nr:PEP-CTERM sorting domain-containing protein [Pirellulales bacterium]